MAVELESLVLSISADTAQLKRALLRTQKDAKDTADNVNRSFERLDPFGRMQQNFNRSSGAMAADAQNLRFQLNDLFTQIQSGTSITQAFGQQAGQISQVLGSAGGVRGAISLVGTALTGMLNPLYLIPIALSAAIPLLTKFFSEAESGGNAAASAFQKHLENIDKVVQKYGDAVPFLKAIRDEAQKAADAAQLQATTAEEIERQWAGVAETFKNLVPAIRDIRGQLRDIGADDQSIALRDNYGELLKAIDENRASAEDLQKFVDLLKAAQKALGNEGVNPTIEAFEKQAAAITKAKDATQKLTQESEKAQGKLKELHSMMIQFQTLDPLGSGGGGFFVLTPEMQSNLDQYRTWVGEAGTLTAKFIKDREQFRSKAYWDVNAFRVGFGSDTYVDELGKVQKVTENTVVTLEQANADLSRRLGEFQAGIRNVIGPEVWKSLDENQQTALTSIAYNYGSLPARIAQAIKEGDRGQVAQAIAGLGTDNNGVNAKRRAMEAELYGGSSYSAKAAKEATPYIDEEARALDGAAAAAAKLLQQQRALTPEQEALARSANQLSQQYVQIAQSAVGGFVNDLRNGVEAGEAFQNMLNRVIDGIINLALEALFAKNALGGVFGNLFGGGGSGVGLYHNGSKTGGVRAMRSVSPAMFAGAPKLHNGLLPGEFPAILQKGEVVLPRSAVRAGMGSNDNSRVDIGNIEINVPGGVAATSDQGKALGLQIDKAVQAVIVRERRPGGLLRA